MNDSTILLTGFEPFGGETVNPSALVARALHGRRIADATVHGVELPCCFGDALGALQAAITATRPQLVLALGQAGGRCDFSIERIAIAAMTMKGNPDSAPAMRNSAGSSARLSTAITPAIARLIHQGERRSLANSELGFICNFKRDPS